MQISCFKDILIFKKKSLLKIKTIIFLVYVL